MKPTQLIPHILAGHIILVAEFRGGRVEQSGFVDKNTGEKTSTLQLTYAVERQGHGMIDKILLRRYLPPDITPEKAEVKLVKGGLYAFVLEKFELKRGMVFGRMAIWEPVMIDKEEPLPLPPAQPEAGSAANLVYNQTTPHDHEQK